MAFNIMDMIKDQITPDNIGAIAGMLGEDEQKTSSGIAGAIPAVLGGLIGAVAKPEGEAAFGQAVEQADTGLVGNLMGALGGGGGSSLVSGGVTLLSSLFGDNKLTALIGAIAGFSGLSKGSSKSLLGLAAPVLMSMLAKKGKTDGLDAKGLIGMLMGQKDNIAKAIPGDLGKSLSASGLLGNMLGGDEQPAPSAPMAAMSAPAAPTPPPARAEPAPPEPEAKKKSSLPGMLVALAVIAAIGWFAYQYFMKPPTPAPSPSYSSAPAEAPAHDAAAATPTLKDTVSGLMQKASEALTKVTSADTATTALPGLQQIDSELGQSVTDAAALSTPQRQALAATVAAQIPSLQGPAEQALAVPGVNEVIGEVVKSMVDKLKQLSQ